MERGYVELPVELGSLNLRDRSVVVKLDNEGVGEWRSVDDTCGKRNSF